MGKPKQPAGGDAPLSAHEIRKYLEARDTFDLELYVYRTAQQAGLTASHGGSYEDPVTKKTRQFDVRAAMERDGCRIDLAIECKALRPSAPLVLSRVPRAKDESFHEVLLSYDFPAPSSYSTLRNLGLTTEHSQAISIPHGYLYGPGEPVGKSTSQPSRKQGEIVGGDSEVYEKWSQALASADDLVSNGKTAYFDRGVQLFLTVVFPVLVVSDDALWVADYSSVGQFVRDPTCVDEGTLFVGRSYSDGVDGPYTISHLHIFTRAGVAAWLDRIARDDGWWELVFPSKLLRAAATKARADQWR